MKASDRSADPALHRAVAAADAGTVEALLKAGLDQETDVDQQNWLGETPLHLAAARGSPELCNLLLRYGANPNAITHSNLTPLMSAVAAGELGAVRLLTSICAALEAPTPGSCSALEVALIHGHMEIAEFLWQHGADIEAKDSDRQYRTLIYRMAEAGKAPAVKFLIEKLVDPAVWTTPDADGTSPLSVACSSGHFAVLREMLSKTGILNDIPEWAPGGLRVVRCNVSIRAKVLMDLISNPLLRLQEAASEADTGLTVAIMSADADAAKAALKAGANPNRVIIADESALSLWTDAFKRLRRDGTDEDRRKRLLEILEAMVNHGLDLNRSHPPRRLLFLNQLVSTDDYEAVRLAIRLGALVNRSDGWGDRPLHAVVKNACRTTTDHAIAMIRLLVSAGADINPCNKNGLTPFHLALREAAQNSVIIALNEIQANVQMPTLGGISPHRVIEESSCYNGEDRKVEVASLLSALQAKQRFSTIFSRKNPLSSAARRMGKTAALKTRN